MDHLALKCRLLLILRHVVECHVDTFSNSPGSFQVFDLFVHLLDLAFEIGRFGDAFVNKVVEFASYVLDRLGVALVVFPVLANGFLFDITDRQFERAPVLAKKLRINALALP